MPRYFFNLHKDGTYEKDATGTNCSDIKAVRREAMKSLTKFASNAGLNSSNHSAFVVLVNSEAGQAVYTATLTFAGRDLAKREATQVAGNFLQNPD